jgi:hypothetical protein
MKKSTLGRLRLARYQSGLGWDGLDEKTRFLHASGLSDVWIGMFMIVWHMTARCPISCVDSGLSSGHDLYSKD